MDIQYIQDTDMERKNNHKGSYELFDNNYSYGHFNSKKEAKKKMEMK